MVVEKDLQYIEVYVYQTGYDAKMQLKWKAIGEGPEKLNSGESSPDMERNPEQPYSSETEPAFDGVDLHKLPDI
jgi:hypothetical protein